MEKGDSIAQKSVFALFPFALLPLKKDKMLLHKPQGTMIWFLPFSPNSLLHQKDKSPDHCHPRSAQAAK